MVREVDTSPKVADEIKTSTCFMCACRCGIRVFLQNGEVRYIEGNRDHPVNHGVLCGKGAAGIMQHNSPARLSAPLLRVGERGSGDFREISWDEALELATRWLGDVRARDPKELAFFTGRDQSQSLTGWWAGQFGTPNYATHGGFCSVNMAAGGLYTIGGSFWEFGEPDWDRTEYFMLFGVAEDHSSNPIKIGLGKLKQRGAKVVAINPIRTGYGAIADEWIGLCPGTDGLFVGALIHELLRTEQVDLDYLVRYTNAPWLVIQDPGGPEDGLFARAAGADMMADSANHPLAWDQQTQTFVDASRVDIAPALVGTFALRDGREAVPVFQLLAQRYLADEYAPASVAERCGIAAQTIRRVAAEIAEAAFEKEITLDIPWTDWAGRHHEKMIGRPVSMHAMRGISAHSNGFHTCRMIHLLQILIGSIDCPGGFRYKPPLPKAIPPHMRPAGKAGTVRPNRPLSGPPLGFIDGPEDLLVDNAGTPLRIDKAYSWDAPIAAHGLMHMVISNAARGDPYPIDVLFMYMANMSWNSSMNTPSTIDHLTAKDSATGAYKIPKIIYSDAYYSEMVSYADLILPDTTYLERWDCMSLLDRPISTADGPADAVRQPVVEVRRDVRPFQDVLIDLGSRLALPGFVTDAGSARYPGGYADYIVNHQREPGIGPLAGWRGEDGDSFGQGAPNPEQLQRYIENGCFHRHELEPAQRFYKHANRDYLEWAKSVGYVGSTEPIILQLYSEQLQKFRLAARGHGAVRPPEEHRQRIEQYFDPLPFWYAPLEQAMLDEKDFPMHAITQRPMHMYHSWAGQNAWLRQITAHNRLYVNRGRATQLGLEDDDWVWLSSHNGRLKAQIKLMEGTNPDTVWTWNAISKRSGAWGLGATAPEVTDSFLLNHLISELLPERDGGYRFSNSDPVTGQAAWYDLRVRIDKAEHDGALDNGSRFEAVRPLHRSKPKSVLRFGQQFQSRKR
jgi:anaerobic selenocysteine-containing dehydrogenase